MDTAAVGQTATQCPHRMQRPFTRAVPSSTSRFDPTQSATHRPHPMQRSASISISMNILLENGSARHGRFPTVPRPLFGAGAACGRLTQAAPIRQGRVQAIGAAQDARIPKPSSAPEGQVELGLKKGLEAGVVGGATRNAWCRTTGTGLGCGMHDTHPNPSPRHFALTPAGSPTPRARCPQTRAAPRAPRRRGRTPRPPPRRRGPSARARSCRGRRCRTGRRCARTRS